MKKNYKAIVIGSDGYITDGVSTWTKVKQWFYRTTNCNHPADMKEDVEDYGEGDMLCSKCGRILYAKS